ncbi:Fe3+-hydroxamate ABC transporter substrate-binding protein [Leptolyngbya sp. 'hensonii']|uniref:ABC transporter substrate-binding protein n=1 Tax=Leptolyngbya sp. 'hensonii' TaxID=1922337 RepID=UPI00094F68D5|nr:iron-siderophore ABC transporter substrate-binding protein [Leptolyngbya sp. 'hensonii']OLP16995.1 Fe3+-hydroxamate ABC transporter substrate-binding protein [Leptolyngbya sp. 'hensonii']
MIRRAGLARLLRFLVFGLLMVMAIVSCQAQVDRGRDSPLPISSSEPTDCRTIPHVMGKTRICGQPQRIAILGPYLLETLLALKVQPVGFADHIGFHRGDYNDPSQQIPYLGDQISQPLVNMGIAYNPSIEAILKVKPDLILGTATNNLAHYETLSKIAPTLLLKYDEPDVNLRTIAKAVNRSEQAQQLLLETRQKIATARNAFAPIVAKYPKLLLLSSPQLREIYLGYSSHGLCSTLLEDLGFQLIAPAGFRRPKQPVPVPISLEALPQLDHADLIVLLGHNFSDLKEFQNTDSFESYQLNPLKQAWARNGITQALNASQAGRVYFIPAYLCLGLPGPIGTDLYLDRLKQQLLTSQ